MKTRQIIEYILIGVIIGLLVEAIAEHFIRREKVSEDFDDGKYNFKGTRVSYEDYRILKKFDEVRKMKRFDDFRNQQ